MSLACLVCHSVESPSHSFRSYSVSSSENDGRCSTISNCLIRRSSSLQAPRSQSSVASTSKVTPQPDFQNGGIEMDGGPPRLVLKSGIKKDLVRNWNFDEVVVEH